MLSSAAQKRREKSKEESIQEARKNAKITVANFIINCLS